LKGKIKWCRLTLDSLLFRIGDMKNKFQFLTLAVLWSVLAEGVFAAHVQELYLYKRDPNLLGTCGRCANEFALEGHQNRTDISDYSSYLQTGYYHMAMYGPPATVTLFGKENYKTDGGFLVVIKMDERPIVIPELDIFPPYQWTEIEPPGQQTGTFRVYYAPHEFFKNNVTSIKWKRWWNQSPRFKKQE